MNRGTEGGAERRAQYTHAVQLEDAVFLETERDSGDQQTVSLKLGCRTISGPYHSAQEGRGSYFFLEGEFRRSSTSDHWQKESEET